MNDLSEHYARLLVLDDFWRVSNVQLDPTSQCVTVRIEHAPGVGCQCPKCGETRPLKDHAAERQWRHLDTMQFETIIRASIPRANCPECGVPNIAIPWAEPHGRFTLMFQAFAIRVLHAAANLEQGRRLLRLSWHSAQQIMTRAVERGLESRTLRRIKYVGIDEKDFGKGHDYISIMTDIEERRVLEVVPESTREATDSLWKTLPNRQRRQIKAVAMDMWPAFIGSAAEHAPQADIVHDRFHISKHLGEAVDQVRRSEHKDLKSDGDERLKGSRYLWLTNPEHLSEERLASFEELRNANLKTSRAWAIRGSFRDLWNQPGPYTARSYFKE